MLDTVLGLPVHPLIVHATVVVVPSAAAAVLAAALWPRFREWAGWLPLGLALAAVVLTPLSTQSGEALQRRVGDTAQIDKHAELADGLVPWVLVLLVGAAGVTYLWWSRRDRGPGPARRWLPVAVIALSVVAALGTTVQVVLIGHTGATAAWSAVGAKQVTGGDVG